MKKLMDIISNWNKGKKAHDERISFKDKVDRAQKRLTEAANRVFSQQTKNEMALISVRFGEDKRPDRIKDVERIFGYIEEEACKDAPSQSFEAKLWQILAEYAQDQVKELTVIKSDIVPTEATNDNSTFNPLKDRISTTIDGDTLRTIIQRAEKRHGYGIQP